MIRIWIAMMLALLLLAGCGGEKDAGYVARKLDIVLPQPAAVPSGLSDLLEIREHLLILAWKNSANRLTSRKISGIRLY